MSNNMERSNKYRFMIEDADEKLRKRCEAAACKIYGNPIPVFISERLETELSAIKQNEAATDYLIGALVGDCSRDMGYPVTTRGKIGSTLTAFLCGFTQVNPLPAHRWCPNCHHLEVADGDWQTTGYDLEDKNCPVCGGDLFADGANIYPEIAMGISMEKVPELTLNVAEEIRPEIIKCLKEEFEDANIYRAGTCATLQDGSVRKGAHPGGIFIIPKSANIEELTELREENDREFKVSITDTDYHELWEILKKYDILALDEIKILHELEKKTGVMSSAIKTNDSTVLRVFLDEGFSFLANAGNDRNNMIQNTIDNIQPSSFYELAKKFAMMHGANVWIDNGEELIGKGIDRRELIATRDDVMSCLISSGMSKQNAYKVMHHIRRGKGVTYEMKQELRDNDVPEWYIESCDKIQYLLPKAHAVEYMLMHWKLAYYHLYFPEEYASVIQNILIFLKNSH